MSDGNMIEGERGADFVAPQNRSEHRPSQPHLEARGILSQAVEAQVLPPERFKGEQKGEIIDLKRIGDRVVALRIMEQHFEATMYDGHGDSVRIPLDPSSHDMADSTSKSKSYLAWTTISQSWAEKPQVIFKRLGFALNEASQLEQQWLTTGKWLEGRDNDGGITITQVQKQAPLYLKAGKWEVEVRKDSSDKEVFFFRVGDTGIVVRPEAPVSKTINFSDSSFADSEDTLPDGRKLTRAGTLFQISDQNGKVLSGFQGFDPIINPTDPNIVYYINSGGIYKLDVAGAVNRTSVPTHEKQITVADPQELEMDPNGNFLIIRSGDNSLSVVDLRNGDVTKKFDDVKGPVLVDEQGDILYADTQGRLREIQTNFQTIPAGGSEEAEKRREEQLKAMQERFANLELGKVEKQKGTQISDADVANTLRDSLSRQVSEPINGATDTEALEDILDRLQGLKGDPSNQGYGDVIDEFIGQAREKLSGIRTSELEDQLATFSTQLEEVQSVGDTIGLDEQFAKLLELRGKIDVTVPQKRREIEQKLRTLQTNKDTINTRYQGELVEAVQQMLPQIEQLIKETGSTQELGYFSTSTSVQQFEQMLANIRDPEVRRELRNRYTQMRTEHRTSLEARTHEIEEQDRQRWAQVVEEAREDLGNLREQIEALSDSRELDRFGRNPLVTAWRAKLFALPPEVRAIEEQKLEVILGARKKDVEHRRELGAVGEGGELKFGNATFPVYKEPPVIWQPKFIPIKGSLPGYADLVFEDSYGRVFKPNEDHDVVVIGDATNPETQAAVDRYRAGAEEYFKGIKRRVPDFDEHWRITDFHMERLEEIAEALNLQLANHRGITIMQGEAGTGKNVLADMLGNLSNRELIQIACNENSTKEDLTYDFYYDPQKGTYKLPSRLIEAIQTPGATILFDEINALKPGLAKMLNSLFDYRRRIYITEGGKEKEIIVDPTVLFLGTMNPQNYAGVNRLSPEVKSRSRVIDIDYPPFEEMRGGRTHYKSDEAEMLAAYMDDLGDLKQKEFKQVWDYVINNDTTNGADAIVDGNPDLIEDTRRVYDVIRVANRLRDMYSAYQIGDSNEPMDFPVSLREVTDIVMEMNHRQGVKQIIKRVIIPKLDDRRQKRLVDQTIDSVLPD